MSLKFNTYRAKRYLRSRFVEGKYLLASEASDLQLESLQVLRKAIEKSLGSAVAIDDAWKVELINSTQILIKPGQAWVKGLPVEMRSGGDQLVSGAVLTVGIVPVGVSVSDEPNGNGKILTFNDGATTPTNTYRLIVSAQEELITDVDDPFLKNINLTESTAQKIRLIYRLNLVPVSLQSTSPVPYRDENSTSLSVTNFPNSGGFAAPNLSNEVIITPTPAGNGELISTNLITGSEGIDGRDVELVIRNDGGLGGIVLPNSPIGQQAFDNSTLIDSNGNVYHVNAIFIDTVSTQLVLRIDKEVDQPNPQIINGKPFKLIKRDVFVTDDVNGSPQGKVYWDVADLEWHQVNEFVHQSNITDLRKVVNPVQMFQETTNQKYNLRPVGGGNVNWDLANQLITWSSSILLLNAHGANQTIPSATVPILEGGSLHYVLKMAGGSIERGTLAVNVTAFGATSSLSAVNLSDVHVGNVIVDSAGTVAEITDIDDVNNTVTTSPALTANGAATIYKDSYGPGKAPLSSLSYVLAVRYNNKVYIGGTLELEDGETSQIGDGVTSALLTFIGSTDENDDSPNYTSEVYISDGDSLVSAISSLDAALDSLAGTVASINWKAPVANYAALPAVGNVDGDARITLDTRAIYTWDNANTVWVETGYWKSPVANAAALPLTNNKNGDIRITLDTHLPYYWDSGSSSWKPVNSTGGGVKIIGGGTLTWNSGSGQLTFSAPMYLEFKGLAYTDNTIPIAQSPITLASNFDVAYVLPNFSTGGPALSVTVAALSAVPANALIIARREGSDVIVGSSSTRLKDGQATELYAQASNQNLAFIGASNTADASPSYSSNIRGTTNENLTARAGVLTDAMGDSQEDRSAYLRSNDPVTWTGSQLQFTSDIVLEIINTKSGTVKTATVLASNSPISLSNGESAWVSIDRTLTSENLTVYLSGTTPIPAQSQANKDIIVLARRQDNLGEGYLYLPFHKQVIEPGQTLRLGASGAGGAGVSEEYLNLKSFFDNSIYKYLVSSIFSLDKSLVDEALTTASFSGVDKKYNFTSGQTLISDNLLDSSYVGLEAKDIDSVGVTVFSSSSNFTSVATVQVSRDNKLTWQTVPITRNDSTNEFSGVLEFSEETYSVTNTIPSNTGGVTLNTTTEKALSQSFTLAAPNVLKEVKVEVTKSGSPGGYLVFSVRKDSSGNPGDEVFKSSKKLVDIASGTSILTFDLTKLTLDSGTYHLVFETDSQYKLTYSVSDNLQILANTSSSSDFAKAYDTSWSTLTNVTIGFSYDYKILALYFKIDSTGSFDVIGFGTLYGEEINYVDFKKLSTITVGSLADVAAGIATHSSIQEAINDAGNGREIRVLSGTYVENVTLVNNILLRGEGNTTVIDGTFTITGNNNLLKELKVEGDLIVNGNENIVAGIWLGSYDLEDNGEENSISLIWG